MNQDQTFGVYGVPSADLVDVPAGAVQLSPLMPSASALEDVASGSLASMTVAAPPGTLERRYVLAQALRALAPGGRLAALAPKDKGGSRLRKELEAFGCTVQETGGRHQRLCQTRRPEAASGLDEAIAAGGPRLEPALGLWTWPGVFSWDRLDPGSVHLIQALPLLAGRGADLGCGLGVLSKAVLAQPAVTELALVDLDRRAVEAARRNVQDPRVTFHWGDARTQPALEALDFVVMNPPFHDLGAEDKALGQAFIRRAAQVLRKGGVLWMVANRHLPYEAVLTSLFRQVALKAEGGGFKVYEARK